MAETVTTKGEGDVKQDMTLRELLETMAHYHDGLDAAAADWIIDRFETDEQGEPVASMNRVVIEKDVAAKLIKKEKKKKLNKQSTLSPSSTPLSRDNVSHLRFERHSFIHSDHMVVRSIPALVYMMRTDPKLEQMDCREGMSMLHKHLHGCFIASKLVDWILRNLPVPTRQEAAKIGDQLRREGYIEHARKQSKPFKDKFRFFRFVDTHNTERETEHDIATISRQAFLAYFKQAHPRVSDNLCNRLFDYMDKERAGALTVHEYRDGMNRWHDDKSRMLFDIYASQPNGHLTSDDLRAMLRDTAREQRIRLDEGKLDEMTSLLMAKLRQNARNRADTEASDNTIQQPSSDETLTCLVGDDSKEQQSKGKELAEHQHCKMDSLTPYAEAHPSATGLELENTKDYDEEAYLKSKLVDPDDLYKSVPDYESYDVHDFIDVQREMQEAREHSEGSVFQAEHAIVRWFRSMLARRLAIFWLSVYILANCAFFLWPFLEARFSSPAFDLIGYSVCFSRGFAGMLYLNIPLSLLTMCRITMLTFVRGFLNDWVPFDYYVTFHKLIAYVIVFATLGHIGGHGHNFYVITQSSTADLNNGTYIHWDKTPAYWELLFTTIPGITGLILLFLLSNIILFSAFPQIRRKSYELFYYVHWACFVPFVLGTAIHGTAGILGFPRFWCFLLIPLTIFFLEFLYRAFRSSLWTRGVTKIVQHPSNVVELQIKKPWGFRYAPGQYLLIKVFNVSPLQWHPFTITSTPEEPIVSVHIRCAGNWTTKLRAHCEKHKESPEGVKVMIDGGFGAPYERIYKYKHLVLVASGIGVTPFASVLKDIKYKRDNNLAKARKLKRVHFIWVNRDQQCFEWFASLIDEISRGDEEGLFQVSTYLTGATLSSDVRSHLLWDGLHHAYRKHKKDYVTGFNTHTVWGRPDWDKTFHDIKTLTGSPEDSDKRRRKRRIGVFFCGAPIVADAVGKACHHHSEARGTRFEFHKEVF
eukprot:TRINITY_DN2669_c0_g2_i2.p1 TRINITY_DN2669_c0_g2~~TRINITY_DN2669_c0_g2_i2.p1  ORF type:complete len:982 (-),score=162.71 TRINITY_DN2669_c0_g2_i2:2021-4966(-)